jgi:D-serine deaminase-like pyridoxal phosphate-dependent protein
MQLIRQDLKKLHNRIDTPALIIDQTQLFNNIKHMQGLAENNMVDLRPHIKTHKSAYIAQRQISTGAKGITVAKVAEASCMANIGIKDIFIANEITHPLKLKRLAKLHEKIELTAGIDHLFQIKLYKKYFQNPDHPLNVMIEIDSGLHRCGVEVDDTLVNLARAILKTPGLFLKGIFTHAGHVYSAETTKQVTQIGHAEGKIVQEAVNLLRKNEIEIDIVSVGSTPTVPYSAKNPVVTEIRPGNYVFFDNIQLALDSCRIEQCSLFVLATIISQPEPDRIVIDAGSKALNLDLGAHSAQLVTGYGRVLNLVGNILRLSEEHGIIKLSVPKNVQIGSPVLIIPNHACAVVNLYEHYYLVESAEKFEKIDITARGKSQ